MMPSSELAFRNSRIRRGSLLQSVEGILRPCLTAAFNCSDLRLARPRLGSGLTQKLSDPIALNNPPRKYLHSRIANSWSDCSMSEGMTGGPGRRTQIVCGGTPSSSSPGPVMDQLRSPSIYKEANWRLGKSVKCQSETEIPFFLRASATANE